MPLGLRGWLTYSRRRFRRRAGLADPWSNRRRLVEELSPGKSFIDIGGMLFTDGDPAFWAEDAGATRCLLYDGMDPSEEFQRKHAERGSKVKFVQGDLHDPQSMDDLGVIDFVHCTGVLYHTPNPYLQIEHLRRITGEHLLLGTHCIPEIPGFENACLWYPALSAEERSYLSGIKGNDSPGMGLASKPFDDAPNMGYAANWFGMPPKVIRSMLEVARFEVIEEFRYDPFSVDFLARPIDRESVIPPVALARERGADRAASFSGAGRPGWA